MPQLLTLAPSHTLLSRNLPVLDHGYVRYVAHMGNDASIIESARMSTSGSFVSWDPYEGHPKGDAGLLDYLYRNGHLSPFEMCDLVIEVQAPIMVVREWFRHRTFSYNEFSARYSEMPNDHYVPSRERIASKSCDCKDDQCGWVRDIRDEQDSVYENYRAMLDDDVLKEVARINTPISRYTKFRAKGNLRNWLQSFLSLRLRPNAQWEIRQYADVVASLVATLWPRTWELFVEHDLNGARLSASEIDFLRLCLLDEDVDAIRVAREALGARKANELLAKLRMGPEKR